MHACGADGEFERNGAVTNRDAMPNAQFRFDLPFELLHERAVVGKPASIQHLVDARQQALAIADIGPTDVERLGKKRRFAENGKIIH